MTRKKSRNPGKMVAGNSSEWLPPGFTEKIKVKNGRKIKYYYNVATGVKYNSKKDVMSFSKSEVFSNDTSQKPNDGLSSNEKIDSVSVETNESPDWLPNGWKMENKIRKNGSREGSTYKVYIDSSTGSRFYSRLAVTRHLKTGGDRSEGSNEQIKLNNVVQSVLNPDMSVQCESTMESNNTPEKKKKKNSFTMVSTECTTADGLPPGWIKEIKTSKSGNKIRKDPYYIDPVSGYIFHSKKDALRYLETNDIGSCAITPKRKESADLELTKNDISLEKVVEKPETSLKRKSVLCPDFEPEKKNKNDQSLTMVVSECTSADGFPPGWIKEIKTSKSGIKIRKDSYYIDPVIGYIFVSKKDAFRYLETKNISSCASAPKRKELKDLEMMKNQILNNVDNPDTSRPHRSITDTYSVPEKKTKIKESFATVSTTTCKLPPGGTKEIKTSKLGNTITQDPINNVDKPETSRPRRSVTDTDSIPEKKTKTEEFFATVATSADELPPGWIKEIKTSKSGDKIRKDPYYTDPVSGYMFRSKKDALRYLETNDIRSCAITPKRKELNDLKSMKNLENVVEKPNMSVKRNSMPGPDFEPENKNVDTQSFTTLNNVDKPDTSRPRRSITDTYLISEKKTKTEESFAKVATSADGLPSGWIKEIKTSKSGDKIRKDPCYIDPVSGYMFRSKKDVLRYLETNDIKSCATPPKRKELNDLKSITNVNSIENVVEKDMSVKRNSVPEPDSEPEKKNVDNRSFTTLNNMDNPETSRPRRSITDTYFIPEKKTKIEESFATVATSMDGLPPGWIKEVKTSKSGDKIRKDPYYIDPVSGYIFRSKKDVLRYLETNDIRSCAITPKRKELNDLKSITNVNSINNVEEPDTSRPRRSITNTYSITEKSTTNKESLATLNNVDNPDTCRPRRTITDTYSIPEKSTTMKESFPTLYNVDNPETSQPRRSITDTYSIPEKKTKTEESFTTVATSADGLPPGWIKEIKTSKSGDKIRKDPYYTHPDSGYIFLSKKDVLRYLETNDIKSCATPPKRKDKTTSRVSGNLSEQLGTKKRPFVGGELNGGGESLSPKILAASTTAKILKQMRDAYKSDDSKITSTGADNLEEKNSNSNKNVPIPPTDVSEQGTRAMDDVLAICSLITEEISPEIEMEKQEPQVGSRKSKKRKDLNLPLRASKRLSGCETEIRAKAKRPSSSEANIDQAKEDGNFQEMEPLNEVQNPLEEESGKQRNESIISQDFNGFGDSWSDPCLEFAFKTLTGEMPMEETFEFQLETSHNPEESEKPIGKVPPLHSESSKKNVTIDPLLGNSSSLFPSVNFTNCSGISSQQAKADEG